MSRLTDGGNWKKSSHSSGNGNCVEVAVLDGAILLRDSKDPQGPVLTFTRDEWAAFVAGTQGGEFGLGLG